MLIEHVAIWIVVVPVDLATRAIRRTNDRAQAIEQVIVLVTIRRTLVVQEAAATANEMRDVASGVLLGISLFKSR